MRPLPFVWPVCLVFWLAYVWVFFPEWQLVRRSRRSPAARGAQDAGSLRVIICGNGLAVAAAFLLAFTARGAVMTAAKSPAYYAGVVMIVAAGLLRRHCFRMLGARFTGAVDVAPGQQVVERGAYRWVRHPSYTAGMLLFAGIGLALGNWASLAVAIVIPLLAYSYRVAVEERALLATIGMPYEVYRTRTRRYIPFVL